MVQFTPCKCDRPYDNCYNCAVELVIRELGWNPDCKCLGGGRSFCKKECGPIFKNWAIAFAMSKASHSELALQRLNSRGMTLQRSLLTIDGEELDVTNEVVSEALIGSSEGHFVEFAHDVENAANELASEVQIDPISFDAGLHLVARQIRLGRPIPGALREWAADTIIGNTERPKQKGKYPNSTLWRDRLIVNLIKDIVDMTNLKPTSGERERGRSACNAVADGLSHLRLQPDSYESMIKIWRRRKKLSLISVPEGV